MSGTLTITVNNGNVAINVGLAFTGGGTCTTQVSGQSAVTGRVMTGTLLCAVPASPSNQTITLSDVSGNSATSFAISTNVDNVISVATSNTQTWGLSIDATPSLTSLASAFDGGTNLTSVPSNVPSSVQNFSNMFKNCPFFNQDLSGWTVQNATNMSGMFNGCTAFNNGGAELWNDGNAQRSLANVTNMSSMFSGCTAFASNIGSWNTSAVTNMSSMFLGCSIFNANISNWNTSNVLTMVSMLDGAVVFNQEIRYWSVRNDTTLTNIFSDPSAFKTAYYGTVVYYSASSGTANPTTTPTYQFFNLDPLTRYPCFMKGTQILCFRGEEEVYRPIQDLRKGDLVKTYRNGYLPIHMIGTSGLSNPGDDERITNRLYKCSKELYPDLFEDLYITGCHSILVPSLTDDQWENTKAILGNVYITDNHFRLMACVDEKAQPYKRDAIIDIYHIALENDDYYMNYGVYANGLLVESCSKRYLTELSNMRIIGEDEACYDTPKVNVFSELGAFVQTF